MVPMSGAAFEGLTMHISDTGVLDRSAYALAAARRGRPVTWAKVATPAKVVPLNAAAAALSAVSLHGSGAGLTWMPLG